MVNLSDSDYGLIRDSITWELELLLLHQGSSPTPRTIRLQQIQKIIDIHLGSGRQA